MCLIDMRTPEWLIYVASQTGQATNPTSSLFWRIHYTNHCQIAALGPIIQFLYHITCQLQQVVFLLNQNRLITTLIKMPGEYRWLNGFSSWLIIYLIIYNYHL